MNQKTLIILVIILVVLFLVSTGAGVIQKPGEGKNNQGTPLPLDLNVGWIKDIGNIFSPRIGNNDVNWAASSCPTSAVGDKQVVLAQPGNCTFVLKESNTRSRMLKVELATDVPLANVDYVPVPATPPDKSDFQVNATLVPAKTDITLSVRQHGGTLTITCVTGNGGGTCLFRLNP